MFSVNVFTVRIDHSRQLLDHSVSTAAVVSTLEKAFEGALKYLERNKDATPAWEDTAESIQIRENDQIVAMATIEKGEVSWLRSPTIADAIKWSKQISTALTEIESKGLNSSSSHGSKPFAFKVCLNVIEVAKQKLMSLYHSRSNDEVYDTLKRVEARLLEKPSVAGYSFEISR